MKWTRSLFLACLTASLAFSALPTRAEEFLVGGGGGGLALIQLLGEAFAVDHPGFHISIVPKLGSAGGIKALKAGKIDLAVIGRVLKAEEDNGELAVNYLADTLLVLVTSRTDIGDVSREQVAGILDGSAPAWSDGNIARVILRPPSDSDTEVLAKLSPALAMALEIAKTRTVLPVASSASEALELAAEIENSFAYSTLALVVTEKPELAVLSLDGVAPTLENLANGTYPMVKNILVVHAKAQDGVAAEFVAFMQSPAGQRIIADNGCRPIAAP